MALQAAALKLAGGDVWQALATLRVPPAGGAISQALQGLEGRRLMQNLALTELGKAAAKVTVRYPLVG